MAGFVECLDNEEAEEGAEGEEGEAEVFVSFFLFNTVTAIALHCNCTAQTHLLPNDPKPPDSDSLKKVARVRHETQIHILNLLITSLELKAPNLALYLLGYEVKKPVSSTNLQDPGQTPAVTTPVQGLWSFAVFCISWLTWMNGCVPGVLGCPRSCLHAILSLLQRGTEKRSGPVLTQQAPHLAELCYQVHFILLSNHPDMSNFITVFSSVVSCFTHWAK